MPYSGRFFSAHKDMRAINAATREWSNEKDSTFAPFWSKTEIPLGLETSVRTPLHKYGYRYWSEFFNPRQMLVHANLLKSILNSTGFSDKARILALAVMQQYLRNQNMFSIWDIGYDKLAPFLSKNNLHPPNRPVENGVFNALGRGNWMSCSSVA